MEKLSELWQWGQANYVNVLLSLSLLMAGLEGIVRITPTKKDDSALERAGKGLKWLMNFLKVPNVKLEDKRLGLHK